MQRRTVALLASLCAGILVGLVPPGGSTAVAASPPKPAISEDARAAVAQMGTTLRAKEFSFHARTIRVTSNKGDVLLHIEHAFAVTARRPDRLLIDATGDDGPRQLIYDGKTAVLAVDGGKIYASLPVPDTIERMMHVVMGRFGVDFPLADFLTEAPDKAFLTGVTAGREIDTVMIDGVPCRHLLFSQPPGIELELWLEKNDRALPRRLIVTYSSLPGKPNFVADMSDWNFTVHPTDADFAFKPPDGAKEVEFGAMTDASHAGAPQ
jgi:hypothetical protein